MIKKYLVFGELTRDNVTVNFNREVSENNEYMATIEAVGLIKTAFGHSVSVQIVDVQQIGE